MPALNPQDTTCSNNFNAGGSFGLQYFGTGCTGGELSHLFVTDLGNKPNESVLNQAGDTAEQIANLALFTNVQSSDYWSGTEYAPVPVGAWFFNSDFGVQGPGVKGNALYAVAVRPGDVAASVPEPQTLALVLLALGATMVVRRRRPVSRFDASGALTLSVVWGLSPGTKQPCGCFVPGEESGLWPDAACKAQPPTAPIFGPVPWHDMNICRSTRRH